MTDQLTLQGWITIGITCLSALVTFIVFFVRFVLNQLKTLITNNTHAMTDLRDTVEKINGTLADHEVRISQTETIHEVRGCSHYKGDGE
jgi:hypothetical protein